MKKIIIAVSILIVIVVIALFVYYIFIVPEFVYVKVDYNNGELSYTTEPNDLLDQKGISKFTDIHMTINNNSQKDCQVEVSAISFREEFATMPGADYGLILSKEIVTLEMCEQIITLDLTNLKNNKQ